MAAQQQPQPAPAITSRSIPEINQTIDTLLKNVDNLTPLLIAREERYGYGDRRVAEGWKLVCGWLEEVDKLKGERRQLYAATTARAS